MENIKEEKEEIITYCSMCGRVLKNRPKGRFILCPRCGVWIPIGSDSYYKIKGGGNMAEKKAKAVAKEEAKAPSAKELIAEKSLLVKEFMDETFKDSDAKEKLKINHAYWKLLKEE